MKNKIAIIDDQPDARQLVADVIEDAIANLNLQDDWEVYASAPLARVDEYPAMIDDNNICILLVDERLGEVPDSSGRVVDYKGSDLVSSLRTFYKELPIYGVTAHPDDPSLAEFFALFDEVIKREEFAQKATPYIEKFLRAYERFLSANEKELAELSQIAGKIAAGEASEEDKSRAEAIQQNLEIPLTARYIGNRQDWLEEYTKAVTDYAALQDEAQGYLNNQSTERQ